MRCAAMSPDVAAPATPWLSVLEPHIHRPSTGARVANENGPSCHGVLAVPYDAPRKLSQ